MVGRAARQILGKAPARIGVSLSILSPKRQNLSSPYARLTLAVGAVYRYIVQRSTTRATPLVVERIREIKAAFPNKPIVAIGGINSGNIDAVIAAGADAAAVISAVVCAPDMEVRDP